MSADSIMRQIDPDPGWQFLRVADENRDNIVYWRYPWPEADEFSPRLVAFKNLMIDVIESKAEFKALPPAEGGRI